ncbi:MAG: hypothetical protein J6X41_05315 [Spirochaetales bacterium]|nr:hypothetical protein [Spirochaetales bacterium]
MKIVEIKITNSDDCLRALQATEKEGAESGLNQKSNLRLRLLAEELIGMVQNLSGYIDALYWVDRQGSTFTLHLKAEVIMNKEVRELLLSTATSGKNSAAKGFMGKLREMIASVMIPSAQGPSVLSGLSIGMMSAGSPVGENAGMSSYIWSLNNYKEKIEESEEAEDLERSIVASLADEVLVSIVGSKVQIDIIKAF